MITVSVLMSRARKKDVMVMWYAKNILFKDGKKQILGCYYNFLVVIRVLFIFIIIYNLCQSQLLAVSLDVEVIRFTNEH